MVINSSNVYILLLKFYDHRITRYLNRHRTDKYTSKQEHLRDCFEDLFEYSYMQPLLKAIKTTNYYDNGRFTGLIARYRNVG